MANQELNTAICTLDDVINNTQIQNEINQTIINLLQEGGGGDTYKLGVNATDVANATVDFLHAKIQDVATYAPLKDAIIASETVSDLKERFFLDVSAIDGYNESDFLALVIDGGTLGWREFGGLVDAYTVKCTSGDNSASYLHDALYPNATYLADTDLVCASMTEGASSTDQKERVFVDVSAIAGWHATEFRLLGIVGNQSFYFTPDEISTNAPTVTIKSVTSVGITLNGEGTGLIVTVNYQNFEVVGTAGSTGSLTAELGLTPFTVKNPTGIELETPTSTSLKVTLPYAPTVIQVLGSPDVGAAADFNDTETGTACP